MWMVQGRIEREEKRLSLELPFVPSKLIEILDIIIHDLFNYKRGLYYIFRKDYESWKYIFPIEAKSKRRKVYNSVILLASSVWESNE